MKKIILIAILFISNYATSQTFTKKDFKDNQYFMTDSVLIENGHKGKVNVFFMAAIPKDKWQEFLTKNNTDDVKGFELMAAMVSITAQYKLKNASSFIPLNKQIIGWDKGFNCYYNMMGRNAYGNLTETKILVTYNPFN